MTKKSTCYHNQKGRASARTSGPRPTFGRAPTPATASHRTPHARIRSRASESRPAGDDRSRASDRVRPSATRSPSRLRPRHQACRTPPTMPRSSPRRAPVLRRALSRPRPFPCPSVSSPLQLPSDRCNIYSILLKHTCIVIATSR